MALTIASHRFFASTKYLHPALSWVKQQIRPIIPQDISPNFLNHMELVIEEAVINIIEHAYDEKAPSPEIEIEVSQAEDRGVYITLRDWGKPYNPLLEPAKSKTLSRENVLETPLGGYGVMLMLRYSEAISYQREGNTNCLIMVYSPPLFS